MNFINSKKTFKYFSNKIIKQIKQRKYTSKCFIENEQWLNCKVANKITTMQFICFNDDPVMISGINLVIEIIKRTIDKKQLNNLKVYGVSEGSIITKNNPILKIIGEYRIFNFLENVIDGILAQCSSVSTNVYNVKKHLLPHQTLIFMGDRNNIFVNQEFDAYAAYVAGIKEFNTVEQLKYISDKNSVNLNAAITHSMIQQYQNDLVKLIIDFNDQFKYKPIMLIDFENDVIKTLNQIKPVLHLCSGVRMDTSKSMIDYSLDQNNPENYGVCINLIKLVKNWLETNNFNDIKICISSSITDKKIITLNQVCSKDIDYIGVGEFFFNRSVHISADLVKIDNKQYAKTGRNELKDEQNFIRYI